MRLSLERKFVAGSAVAFCVLGAVCLLSFRAVGEASATSRRVTHTYEVLAALDATLGSVISAESRVRGFLVTGQEDYLERRKRDLARLAASLDQSRKLTSDNPLQQQRIDELERLLIERRRVMEDAIAYRREHGVDGLAPILLHGQEVTDKVRAAIATMEQNERELLDQRQHAASSSVANTTTIIILGGIADGLLFLFAIFTIRREMRLRRELESALRRDAERLTAMVKTQAEIVETELDLQRVIEIVAKRAQQLTQASGASIDLLEGDRLVQRVATGTATSTFELRRKIFASLTADCLRRDEAIICEDVQSSNGNGNAANGSEARSAILVPLRSGTKVVGILKVFSDKVHGFAKADAQTLEVIAGLIANATSTAAAFAGRQQLISELTTVNEELEAFSYSVSHDLRAPLRHIHGFVDLLRRHLGEGVDETGHRYLKVIGDSAKKMGVLIDDLLAFARVGRAQLHITRVELFSLVHEVVDEMRGRLGDRKVDWNIGALPPVQGDPALLRQVFVNLIDNALKYSRDRSPSVIEIDAKREHGETIVWIRDNGVGFDPQYRNKLFGVFERLHNEEDFEGTGIGLANVRRIIQKHGGRTWAEGALGEGATFYFSFPPAKTP